MDFLKNPAQGENEKSLLHAIGVGWYVNKIGQKLTTLKKSILRNKSQKEEDEIKIKLTESNKYLNAWRFQIHWNKLEWENPRSHDKRKNSFYVSTKNIFL